MKITNLVKSVTFSATLCPMDGAITIYQPPGQDFAELAAAFEAQVGPGWHVCRVGKVGALLKTLGNDSIRQLAVIPQAVPEQRYSPARLIARIHASVGKLPVVVAAERGSVDAVAEAIAAGATDFLVCGERLGERIATLLGKLRGLFDVLEQNRRLDENNARLRESLERQSQIVGTSPQVKTLLARIARVAPVPRPILIVGERGTGKELVARAIHRLASSGGFQPPSSRRDAPSLQTRQDAAATLLDRPLVTVNCAAFTDALLESELFGHEKGAFTGADATRRGKFEQASGGTLFLDEIGHMSLPFQQKILRVVEYGAFTRVGGHEELRTSARIVAATNCDLRGLIRAGRFLADLYDRLAFEVLEVPPLRDRPADVAVLAEYFLDEFARETPAFRGKRLSRAALEELARYSFPGNVRELKNIIERAAYRDTDAEISPAELGLPLADESPLGSGGGFEERVEAFQRRLIVDALAKSDGNQAAAARLLGLSYHQFRYYRGRLAGAK